MDQGLTLEKICTWCGGEFHGSEQDGITTLAYDSRRIKARKSIMFIALKGAGRDGHHYIEELYHRGLRAFMVSELPDLSSFPDAGFCLVKDGLSALQKLAAAWRDQYRGMVLAITGSNGKTIVKEWIYQILAGERDIYRSPKSFNSQLGVPVSLWNIRSEHEMAIIEAGISRPGEMERLAGMIKPRVGLFTNLGSAHQEHFKSPEQKFREKMKLFKACDALIYRKDSKAGDLLSGYFAGSSTKLVDWSLDGTGVYSYRLFEKDGNSAKMTLEQDGGPLSFTLPFNDDASIENALHALTFALHTGLDVNRAVHGLGKLEPVSMRLEILHGLGGSTLINDSYNADAGGLEAALDLLNQQKQNPRKMLILSDLLQSGVDEAQLYREVAARCEEKDVDQIYCIGPAMCRQSGSFPLGTEFHRDTEDFLEGLDPAMIRNAAVLIKGSRIFGFERITAALQEKTHLTRLEINMNAIGHNLSAYRSRLGKGVKVMVMVKALSYGSGHVALARFLQLQEVDYLAVAYVDEGIELRHAGIHLPIMVLNAYPGALGQTIEYGLEPVIYSSSLLDALLSELKYRQLEEYPVHLKIDTGMHRLGFQPRELEGLTDSFNRKEIYLASAFSHLAASEDPAHDEFTRRQIMLLDKTVSELGVRLGRKPEMHILNSAGIERFPEAQFQMVRLGIGLHGFGRMPGLQPASRFVSTISQVKDISKGESIGYGRMGKAVEDMRIAILPVGYADGLDRRLGNGLGFVSLDGNRLPVLGNICMDMTMVDVTGLEAGEGDEVEIFGPLIPVPELAALLETIPYEVLTSVPERVKRVYLQE